MKKILLTCCLALGIGASAQYNFVGDFEGDALVYGQFGGRTITAAAACTGSLGGQLATSATVTQTGWMVQMDEAGQAALGNGQAINVTLKYKKASGPVGTLYVTLFEYDEESDQWSLTTGQSVALTSAALTTCSTLTGTIPAGYQRPGKSYGIGAFYVRTSGSGNVYLDDIAITQDAATAVPGCTSLTYPTNGSTIGAGAVNFTWPLVAKATDYKLTVGTTPGASDVYNGSVPGYVTSQYVGLAVNSNYYAKIIATNNIGDAVGCSEINFNTNNTASYCTVGITTVNASYERISNVKFADINNPSSTTANAYEDFTSITGNVMRGESYLMTATISGFDSDRTSVWIDYNQDKVFSDSERVDLTSTASATGTITIPDTALLGNTTMRVRVNYNAAPPACGITNYGQVEDYTINIKAKAAPGCVTYTTPTTGATNVATNVSLAWTTSGDGTAGANSTKYKNYVGTTPGGTDVVNGTLSTTTTFAVPGLNRSTIYYAKVVPTNTVGDATGCSEISFTTGPDWSYCAATHATVNADRMSNVAFADINNPSTVTTITGGYEDFTAIVGNVEAAGIYPIAITTASGNANDKVKVWIDSNQNGTFEDSEMTLLNFVSTTSTTGSITIPSGATLGNTRMRIRLSRQANATSIVACGAISAQGRTQDYTLKIVPAGTLAATDINKGKNISVYPNPFTDVLKISDVKGVKSVSINDVSGREVKSLAPSAELNLSSLKAGLYIVTLKMEDGSVKTFKAIKK